MGLYAYWVIQEVKPRLMYNKSLLKMSLSFYWNTGLTCKAAKQEAITGRGKIVQTD